MAAMQQVQSWAVTSTGSRRVWSGFSKIGRVGNFHKCWWGRTVSDRDNGRSDAVSDAKTK